MLDNQGLILEKLGINKRYKSSIPMMWRTIRKIFLSNENLSFIPNSYPIKIPDNIPDLGEGVVSATPQLDFDEAKSLFIEGPYVVFGLDGCKSKITKESIDRCVDDEDELLLKSLAYAIAFQKVGSIENSRPLIYSYLTIDLGYNPDKEISSMDLFRMMSTGYWVGLKNRLHDYLMNNVVGKTVLISSFSYDNLFSLGYLPLFVWDVENGKVHEWSTYKKCDKLDEKFFENLHGRVYDEASFMSGSIKLDSRYEIVSAQNIKYLN